jgi:AraC-like DNA-binding protein
MSDEKFNVEVLSEEMYMSRTQIHRKLKAIVGLSTTQYIKKYKMQKAMQDLKDHTGTISEIAYRYGFSSPAYFSRVFQDIYGKKPSTVRND